MFKVYRQRCVCSFETANVRSQNFRVFVGGGDVQDLVSSQSDACDAVLLSRITTRCIASPQLAHLPLQLLFSPVAVAVICISAINTTSTRPLCYGWKQHV